MRFVWWQVIGVDMPDLRFAGRVVRLCLFLTLRVGELQNLNLDIEEEVLYGPDYHEFQEDRRVQG